MTRPVSETTSERQISGIDFENSQLERRPAPPSSESLDSRSYAVLVRNDDFTIADTTVDFPFTDANATNVSADEGAVSVIEDSGILYFQFNEVGFYAMFWACRFSANFDGAVQIGFECLDHSGIFAYDSGDGYAPAIGLDYADTGTTSLSTRFMSHCQRAFVTDVTAFTPFVANWSSLSRDIVTMHAVAYHVTPAAP